jgi:glycerate 2-kinase
MKIVVAPDKFKGSLPATQVAAAIAAGLYAGQPGAEVVTIPVADGGEGTVDATVTAGFERVPVTAAGPDGDPVRTSYARRGEVAVVEVLRAALEAGARRIVLGVGGSASTDGGAGLLQALGARLLDTRGEPVRPGGGALRDVATLDLTGLHPALQPALHPAGHAADIILAADVDNPLAVLGATRRPGIELVLDLADFEDALDGADLVITGEGSLDAQSLAGKAPVGVARAAARHGIGVVAVAGRSTLTEAELAAAGIVAVYSLSDLEPDLERCRAEAAGCSAAPGR